MTKAAELLKNIKQLNGKLDIEAQEEDVRVEREVFLLLNAITDMVLVSDNSGSIKFANPSSYRVLGYDPDELLGKDICDILDCEDIQDRIDTSLYSIAKGKDGGIIPIHMYVGSIKDGGLNLLVSVIRKVKNVNTPTRKK